MVLIQSSAGASFVPHHDDNGETYHFEHAGSVLDVDPATAEGLVRVAGFRELPPDHPDVPVALRGEHEGADEPAGTPEGGPGQHEAPPGTPASTAAPQTAAKPAGTGTTTAAKKPAAKTT